MSRRVATAVFCLSASIIGMASTTARAQGTSDSAAAEALFNEARKLVAEGAVDAACPKFKESYRLDPGLGTLLNLASCHEKQGRTASAWGEYRDAEQQARTASDRKREVFAKRKAAQLEPHLAKMRIAAATPIEGMIIKQDGTEIGVASFDTELPVDPGDHELLVEAEGYEPWSGTFEAIPEQTVEVSIPVLVALPPPAPDDGLGAASPRPEQTVGRGDTQRTVGLILGGTGLASFAVAGVFAGLTASKKSSADELCDADKRCVTEEAKDAVNGANTFATVSNVTLIIGGIAATAGIVLYLTAPSDPEDGDDADGDDLDARVWLGFTGTEDAVGLGGRFRF